MGFSVAMVTGLLCRGSNELFGCHSGVSACPTILELSSVILWHRITGSDDPPVVSVGNATRIAEEAGLKNLEKVTASQSQLA